MTRRTPLVPSVAALIVSGSFQATSQQLSQSGPESCLLFPSPPTKAPHGQSEYTIMKKGLPRWHRGKGSTCQRRRLRFDFWAGKVPRSRKRQPTPVFLPGKSRGQRSLVGYSPQGRKESDTTGQLIPHMHALDVKRRDFGVTGCQGSTHWLALPSLSLISDVLFLTPFTHFLKGKAEKPWSSGLPSFR